MRERRWRSRLALGCALTLSASVPQAGEPPAASLDEAAGAPRFAIQSSSLRSSPNRDRVDGRFQVQARLAPEPGAGQHAGGIELHAKLVSQAAAAACSNGASIFADGFE